MQKLDQFIKAKRESAGLSQQALSSACGVSDTTIFKLENGKTSKPSWDLLCKIAKALDFHVFEILEAAGYITIQDINPTQLIKRLDKLDSNELEMVQLFVDFIISQKQNSKGEQ